MEQSGSSITCAVSCGAQEERKPGSTTSCTGRPSLRRCYLPRAGLSACSRPCCGERIVTNHSNETELLPLDPKTRKQREQMEQPGYYPGYKTLGQKKFWDATTRRVVEDRVGNVPPIQFFSPEETPIISAVCDRVMPQHDRPPQFRIPVVNAIDERLAKNEISGYRFEDIPDDRDAYRFGIQAIEMTARAKF